MVGSLSSGSSGPRPVISSRISSTKSSSSCGVERQALDQDVLRDELLDVRAHLVLRQLLQRREVDLLDQPAVQAHLGVEQLVAEQRIGMASLRDRLRTPGPGTTVQRHAVERAATARSAGTTFRRQRAVAQ